MDHLLPPLFIVLAALCLCVGLYAMWQSLRVLLAARAGHSRITVRSDREQLVEQKAALLRTLKELRFERDLGKISDQDYEALDARYRAQAKKVLRRLDAQLGEFRGKAEALIDTELAGGEREGPVRAPVGGGDRAGPPAVASEAQTRPAESSGEASAAGPRAGAQVACVACAADNDADAVFCKKCGQRMTRASDAGAGAGGDV